MALTNGKCSKCGEIIKINAEKEKGFCSKCGQQIDVQQSIALFDQGHTTEKVQSEKKQRAEKTNADAKIKEMFEFCSSESDFLMLRSKIMEMTVGDAEKAKLLEALDQATKRRLADTLKKAETYKSDTESPVSGIVGCIVIVGIGFAVNYFLNIRWPGIVALALCILCIVGILIGRFDKKTLEENKEAADLIALYRSRGYKI